LQRLAFPVGHCRQLLVVSLLAPLLLLPHPLLLPLDLLPQRARTPLQFLNFPLLPLALVFNLANLGIEFRRVCPLLLCLLDGSRQFRVLSSEALARGDLFLELERSRFNSLLKDCHTSAELIHRLLDLLVNSTQF
jgi:hypothetical protein